MPPSAPSLPFDLIETMPFDPEDGVLRIEAHLARMKASAEVLGFAFDRHDARNELQAATFRLRRPATVRLLAARTGRIAIEIGPAPTPYTAPLDVALAPLPVPPGDSRLRHKSSARAFLDRARLATRADEVAFVGPDGLLAGGSFTTIFVARGGSLVTPPLARGPLPGILRAELIAQGRATEGDLAPADLTEGFFVGNALHGLMPAVVTVAKSGQPPL